MTTYLDEDQVGTDPNSIGYPHLLLCMGVTFVMDDGSLIGAHFTNGNTEGANTTNMRNALQATTAVPVRLYVTGDFKKHISQGGKTAQEKAAALGYNGNVYSFDTASIKPKDGTFVRLTSKGPNAHPEVEYKRNEKVLYTNGMDRNGRDNVTALSPAQARFFKTDAIPYKKSKIGFHTVKDKEWKVE